eukprot:snap_masked-scaffold_6-processed-gene-4.49-mRNA-1 protein AED:1.00 eAED:1.00 QI:0/-1/0/0/-1/1/1/0/541
MTVKRKRVNSYYNSSSSQNYESLSEVNFVFKSSHKNLQPQKSQIIEHGERVNEEQFDEEELVRNVTREIFITETITILFRLFFYAQTLSLLGMQSLKLTEEWKSFVEKMAAGFFLILKLDLDSKDQFYLASILLTFLYSLIFFYKEALIFYFITKKPLLRISLIILLYLFFSSATYLTYSYLSSKISNLYYLLAPVFLKIIDFLYTREKVQQKTKQENISLEKAFTDLLRIKLNSIKASIFIIIVPILTLLFMLRIPEVITTIFEYDSTIEFIEETADLSDSTAFQLIFQFNRKDARTIDVLCLVFFVASVYLLILVCTHVITERYVNKSVEEVIPITSKSNRVELLLKKMSFEGTKDDIFSLLFFLERVTLLYSAGFSSNLQEEGSNLHPSVYAVYTAEIFCLGIVWLYKPFANPDLNSAEKYSRICNLSLFMLAIILSRHIFVSATFENCVYFGLTAVGFYFWLRILGLAIIRHSGFGILETLNAVKQKIRNKIGNERCASIGKHINNLWQFFHRTICNKLYLVSPAIIFAAIFSTTEI